MTPERLADLKRIFSESGLDAGFIRDCGFELIAALEEAWHQLAEAIMAKEKARAGEREVIDKLTAPLHTMTAQHAAMRPVVEAAVARDAALAAWGRHIAEDDDTGCGCGCCEPDGPDDCAIGYPLYGAVQNTGPLLAKAVAALGPEWRER